MRPGPWNIFPPFKTSQDLWAPGPTLSLSLSSTTPLKRSRVISLTPRFTLPITQKQAKGRLHVFCIMSKSLLMQMKTKQKARMPYKWIQLPLESHPYSSKMASQPPLVADVSKSQYSISFYYSTQYGRYKRYKFFPEVCKYIIYFTMSGLYIITEIWLGSPQELWQVIADLSTHTTKWVHKYKWHAAGPWHEYVVWPLPAIDPFVFPSLELKYMHGSNMEVLRVEAFMIMITRWM